MNKFGIGALLIFFLAGCASADDCYVTRTCVGESAFAAGINDANNNDPPRANYAENCPSEYNRGKLNAAYRRGYHYAEKYEQVPPNDEIDYRPRSFLKSVYCAVNPGTCIAETFPQKSCGVPW